MIARVLAAVVVVSLWFPASAHAQTNLWCQLTLGCNQDSSIATWSQSRGCFCHVYCNNDNDCPSDQACDGSTGFCEIGTRTVPPPSHECTVDTDCRDDGNACDGREVCVAGSCAHAGRMACDDGNAATIDSCAAPGTCLHDPKTCAAVRVVHPTVQYSLAAIGATGLRSFQAGGTLAMELRNKAPFEINASRIQVRVGDKLGRTLVDATVSSGEGTWTADKDGGWTWKGKDPKAPVQVIHFGAHNKSGHAFTIRGSLPAENLSFKGTLNPAFALTVAFPATATLDSCAAVATPVCLPRNMDQGRFMVCGDGLGGGIGR